MLVITITSNDNGRSFTASCEGVSYSHSRKDPIAPLCRRLIDHGHSPDMMVMVCRGAFPVMKPRSLGAWAEHDIVEDDNRGLLRRRYRALPDIRGDAATQINCESQAA
ncbi:hypothetical protein [Mesorhizobium sp. KR2-14]|uniref:hypothetical protein n=1 Tax=Mesorhizobium sp. KR2-14 TaxID=3156610 RepID=UPI0032B60BD2